MKWKFIRFPLEKIKWDCCFPSFPSVLFAFSILFSLHSSPRSLPLPLSSSHTLWTSAKLVHCEQFNDNSHHMDFLRITHTCTAHWITFQLFSCMVALLASLNCCHCSMFILFKPMSWSSMKFMSIFVCFFSCSFSADIIFTWNWYVCM